MLWEGCGDVVLDEGELWMVLEVRHIGGASSAQIVDRYHFVTAAEQCVSHVRADESGTTGQKHAHDYRPTPS